MGNTFLQIPETVTLKELSSTVGSRNVNAVLNVNNITRTRTIGQAVSSRNQDIRNTASEVSWKRKSEILNNFATDSDVFEKACIESEDGWKVLSETLSFSDTLAIPETVELVRYDDVLGNGKPVTTNVYNKVMKSLRNTGRINSNIFNDFSTIKPCNISTSSNSQISTNGIFQAFNVPWGDITFYSKLAGTSVDIPSYPDSIKEPRTASYNQMPDTLYQYEPWYTYSSSGPRSITVDFHLHRQMWTGDERDGKANELIRFIQAATYPRYFGSCVNSDTCTLYIKGSPYITGIVEAVDVQWEGPIGLDGFYLEFTISITFTEISSRSLNFDVVKDLPIIA